jgi:TonB family protein
MASSSGRKTLLTIAGVALIHIPCGAQTVQGILLGEKSRRPIGHARVALVDSLGRFAAETITDTSLAGAFYLTAPKPGRYGLRIVVGHGGGVSHSPFFSLDSNQVIEKTFVAPEWPRAVLEAYLPENVTKPAAFTRSGTRPPRFPDRMRSVGRDGLVRVRFVVDGDGSPDMSTFEVIESDDRRFAQSVREAVAQSRFQPAERDGTTVPQVFDFAVDFGFGDAPPKLVGKNVMMVRAFGVRYP